MVDLIGITVIIIYTSFFALLVIGLLYSKIHSFKPGVYFFLLFIIHEIYSLVGPSLIQNYIDKLMSENKRPLMGMSFGEFVALSSFIPKLILFAALLILVIGLRSFWKKASLK